MPQNVLQPQTHGRVLRMIVSDVLCVYSWASETEVFQIRSYFQNLASSPCSVNRKQNQEKNVGALTPAVISCRNC